MINILWINLIVALVFLSGFWDVLDSELNKRVQFAHLPHIFTCALCQCWWLSLLYIIIAGKLTLLNVLLCLVNAHLTEITIPMITTVKNYLLKVIEWLNGLLY